MSFWKQGLANAFTISQYLQIHAQTVQKNGPLDVRHIEKRNSGGSTPHWKLFLTDRFKKNIEITTFNCINRFLFLPLPWSKAIYGGKCLFHLIAYVKGSQGQNWRDHFRKFCLLVCSPWLALFTFLQNPEPPAQP